jgi:hypothetical protein
VNDESATEEKNDSMKNDTIHVLKSTAPTILKNITCPYCGKELNDEILTKEHVIGRAFVPKGSLKNSWNLILNACSSCNNKKSDLEDDLSAITLSSRIWHNHGDENDEIISEAERKAKGSHSRRTKKPVAKSQEDFTINSSFGNVGISLQLIAPPQLDNNRLFALSLMQLMAFFYFITYDEKSRKGYFWVGSFIPVHIASANDWGNSIQMSFMNAVNDWKLRWHGIAAECFYKSIIKKHPQEDCWSWAIEFNKGYRAIGFFGDEKVANCVYQKFKVAKLGSIMDSEENTVCYVQENSLDELMDIMFKYNPENEHYEQ